MKVVLLTLSVMALLVGCTAVKPNKTGGLTSVSRTISERLTDGGIERQVAKNLSFVHGLSANNYRVGINAFRGDVLLTGEVPNDTVKAAVAQMVKSIPEVGQVYNFLVISEPRSQSHTLHENYLKAKIVTKIMAQIRPSQYLIVVRNDIAYVMGVLTQDQMNLVNHAITSTDGILGSTTMNTLLLTQEELAQRPSSTPTNGYVLTQPLNQNQPNPYYAPVYSPSVYPAVQPAVQPAYPSQPNANSDYIRLYQGTNKP